MRIATFNINNVNKRLANLLHWLATAQPDVVCLQELKADDRDFHAAELMATGVPVVRAGDYNVDPTEPDIWPGRHEQDNALFSRKAAPPFDGAWTRAGRTPCGRINPTGRSGPFGLPAPPLA